MEGVIQGSSTIHDPRLTPLRWYPLEALTSTSCSLDGREQKAGGAVMRSRPGDGGGRGGRGVLQRHAHGNTAVERLLGAWVECVM